MTVRVGVAGLGYWGPNLARNLAAVPGCAVTWLCDAAPEALERVAAAHPRTRAAVAFERIELGDHVRLLPPAGYLDFAALASQARLVLTDSGGVQKEAYWHGVPCVTLRSSTEWPETVEAGWNRLVGTDPDRLAAAVRDTRPPAERPPLYGDGRASERIADLLATTITAR